MCERLRLLPWWQKIILALAGLGLLAHATISIARVGRKIGDYDINREFGRRFLTGEPLYQGGQCFNYMPISALYWAPMALLPPRAGMVLRYLTALGCLLIIIRILRRMVSREWLVVSGHKHSSLAPHSILGPRSSILDPRSFIIIIVTLVLGGHYLIRDFDDGGPNVIVLAILLAGMDCIWQGRDLSGAFWLGLGIAVKITPGLVLPYLLWKRRWRAAAYTTAATLLWIIVPALWMGPASWWRHQRQWNEVAMSVLHDSADPGRDLNEQRVQNQALKPALLRYLETYPPGHPLRLEQAGYVDFLNWPPRTADRLATGILLAVGGIFCWRTRRPWPEPHGMLGELSALLLLMLLFSPVTWLQHFVCALPAIFWLVAEQNARPRTLRLCGLISFGVLSLLMNRQLLGRETYLLLLSYHTHTLCLLLLFTLVVAEPSSPECSAEEESVAKLPAIKSQAA
jgi:alpha-1,2-mannosyltransferase